MNRNLFCSSLFGNRRRMDVGITLVLCWRNVATWSTFTPNRMGCIELIILLPVLSGIHRRYSGRIHRFERGPPLDHDPNFRLCSRVANQNSALFLNVLSTWAIAAWTRGRV